MTLHQLHFVPPVPLLVAQELGLLAEAGIDIEARRTRSSDEQLKRLASGDVDLVVTAMDNVFLWNQLGADVRIVAQTEQTTLLTVYGRPGLRALSDVEGGRFGVDALANGFAIVARALLAEAGVTADFVQIGGVTERLDALVAGTIDATLLGPPLDELAERAGMTRLASANEAFPSFPGQGVVVRADRSVPKTCELGAYLDVLQRAVTASESMTDANGIELLARHGFPRRSAADAWQTRPRSLAIDPTGVALVESLRARFAALPHGYAGRESLVDQDLAGRSGNP